jgi:DNA-binding transcriptional LysR family regulator
MYGAWLGRWKSKDRIGRIRMADLTGFDLNLLRVFAAVMRERSVTRAGDQIGMSQPAVSAALNRLRYALDDQLFVRRGNDMVPTPRAEDLIGPVQEALNQLDVALQGRRDFNPSRAERTYTVLGGDFVSLLVMPVLSDRIAQLAPSVRLRQLDFGHSAVERLLQEDSVDVVLEGPLGLPEWVSRQVLFESHFCVVARADLAVLVAAGVEDGALFPIDLFCELPHALRTVEGGMTGFTDAALAKIGRARRVVLAVPHFQAVLHAVARGALVAVVPRKVAEPFAGPLGLGIYEPPLELPAPEIMMYWHSRHDRSPAHRWLRNQVFDAVTEVLGLERNAPTA